MMYAAIDYTSPLKSFGEVLSFGGQMVLIGMATVFAVLCSLWLCLTVFKTVFTKKASAKKKESETKTVTAPIDEPVYVADDGEIVAAIAAAIAMAESECEHTKFRVVSFKRK